MNVNTTFPSLQIASLMVKSMFSAAQRFGSTAVLLKAFRLVVLSGNAAASRQNLPREDEAGGKAALQRLDGNSPAQSSLPDGDNCSESTELSKDEEDIMEAIKDVIEV